MHASNSQKVVQGKMVLRRFFVLAIAAPFAFVASASFAQEVDGTFEGEKSWQDKSGESHDIKPPNPRDKNRQRWLTITREGKWSGDTDEQIVQEWTQYQVRAITWQEHIGKLPDLRRDLKKLLRDTGKAPAPELHTQINDLTLKVCSAVAQDSRYPRAVRINCVLMLGDLDEREASPGGPAAVPLPAATTALLDIAGDQKQYLGVRIVAVIGLKRHVESGMANTLQARLADTLVEVLQAQIEEDYRFQGEIWLHWRAADVLSDAIKKQIPVDLAKYATGTVELIDEDKLPNWARAKLAGDLGLLKGRDLPAPQIPIAVRSVAGLTLAIAQTSPFAVDQNAEAEKAKAEAAAKEADEKKSANKKGKDKKADEKKDDSKKEDKPAAVAKAAAEPPSPAVQKLQSEEMMWQLSQIRLALYGKDAPKRNEEGPDAALGLCSAADDATKAMADKVVIHIDEIVKSLTSMPDDNKETLNKLANTIQKANDDLEDLLAPPAAEEAEAADAPAPVAGRARPPAGNTPADVSATGK